MERIKSVDYLRLSLTDNCNLNCFYCNPKNKKRIMGEDEVLSVSEIVRAVSLFAQVGIKKVRLTGGEPLLREDICEVVHAVKKIEGVEEVSLTTNGVYLDDLVDRLTRAGLDRVNVSLDTLNKRRYKDITGRDCFNHVWQGIERVITQRIIPLKINVILQKSLNEDEIFAFVNLAISKKVDIRFIELFKTSTRLDEAQQGFLKTDIVKMRIEEKYGKLLSIKDVISNGPAEYFKLERSQGAIGFISNLSNDFCGSCNRLRMDSSGKIAPCLFSGYMYDIKGMLNSDVPDKEILLYLKDIVVNKYKYNKKSTNKKDIEMSSVGG